MGRSNEEFEMFHVSKPAFRESIAKEGLKAQEVFNEDESKGPGVWVADGVPFRVITNWGALPDSRESKLTDEFEVVVSPKLKVPSPVT